MGMQYSSPPSGAPPSGPTINWHSPLPYLVIAAGGIALFLLYEHFVANSASSSTSPASSATGTVPYVDETVYDQTLQGPQATPPTGTAQPYPIKGTGVYAPPATPTPGPPGTRRAHPYPIRGTGVYTPTTSAPPFGGTRPPNAFGGQASQSTQDQPPQVPVQVPPGVVTYDREQQLHGEGPGNAGWVHIPTWPYGGQRLRPRLG